MVDSGSQKSFISPKLAQDLKLPVINKVRLQLSTFGKEAETHEFDVVKARIQMGGYNFVAKLIIHNNINTQFRNPGIVQIQRMLKRKGVHLADKLLSSEIITDIEVLIGIDYFPKVVISQ